MYASKDARRTLVKNALDMQRRVIVKEQEVRYNELQAARQQSSKYGGSSSSTNNNDNISVDLSTNEETVEMGN